MVLLLANLLNRCIGMILEEASMHHPYLYWHVVHKTYPGADTHDLRRIRRVNVMVR